MNHILFHSRAKCDIGKFLSNPYPCKVETMDQIFHSVENAFQASKFIMTNKPEYFDKLVHVTPAEANKMGSKGGMTKLGATLDLKKWKENRDEIMDCLIISRYINNKDFQKTIDKLNADDIQLYHFERYGHKAYWGGAFNKNKTEFIGENKLGKIMMNLG